MVLGELTGFRGRMATRLQSAEIDFHRRILGIRPVDLHHIPGWFMERVCWATRGWGRIDAESGMQFLAQQFELRIFDHWGDSTNKEGNRCFATEPYISAIAPLPIFWERLIEFSSMLGLHVKFFDHWESWWYPGYTARIEFSECNQTPICQGCMTREQARDASRDRRKRTALDRFI